MKLSKTVVDRARPALRRYQKILQSAHGRDCNESDTPVIVADLLAEVLGWDKYNEVTTEFAGRSTFCDLALKVDGKVAFLIGVKCSPCGAPRPGVTPLERRAELLGGR